MNQSGARIGGLAVRALLALATAGTAVPAYRYAEVAALRTNAPLEAAKVAPHDAKALAYSLGSKFDRNPEFKPSERDISDLETALVALPLEPKLLSIMGLAYEANGDTRRAADVMRVANLASRRDSVSGLYLIESASASGDIKATLRHYNALLSTQPQLRETLLPILASAITFSEIRTGVVPYLKSGVNWTGSFLSVVSEKSSIVDLKLLLPQIKELASDPVNSFHLSKALSRAALEGSLDDVVYIARFLIPGFRAEVLSDFGINSRTTDRRLGALSWNFPAVENIAVEQDGGQAITINADPLARGTVATRDVLVEGGKAYRISQRISFATSENNPSLRWSAACVRSMTETAIFWDQVQASRVSQAAMSNVFTVPKDCRLIRMSVTIEGPDGQVPASVTLDKLALSKLP